MATPLTFPANCSSVRSGTMHSLWMSLLRLRRSSSFPLSASGLVTNCASAPSPGRNSVRVRRRRTLGSSAALTAGGTASRPSPPSATSSVSSMPSAPTPLSTNTASVNCCLSLTRSLWSAS